MKTKQNLQTITEKQSTNTCVYNSARKIYITLSSGYTRIH